MSRPGARGERIACTILRRRGYRVVARNVRRAGGEVDIVAVREGVVVFFEVKTRTTDRAALNLLDAIDREKRRRVMQTGRRWLAEQGQGRLPHRLAAVCVQLPGRGWRSLLRRSRARIVDPLPEACD